jgi:hypothetical protein
MDYLLNEIVYPALVALLLFAMFGPLLFELFGNPFDK